MRRASRLGKSVVMLNHDAELFAHHIADRLYDFSVPYAAVAVHPTNPNIWGLKNLSEDNWIITTAEGNIKEAARGKSITLAAGTKIQFGKIEGEIRI